MFAAIRKPKSTNDSCQVPQNLLQGKNPFSKRLKVHEVYGLMEIDLSTYPLNTSDNPGRENLNLMTALCVAIEGLFWG